MALKISVALTIVPPPLIFDKLIIEPLFELYKYQQSFNRANRKKAPQKHCPLRIVFLGAFFMFLKGGTILLFACFSLGFHISCHYLLLSSLSFELRFSSFNDTSSLCFLTIHHYQCSEYYTYSPLVPHIYEIKVRTDRQCPRLNSRKEVLL